MSANISAKSPTVVLWIGTQAGMVRLTRSKVSVASLPKANDSDFESIYRDCDSSFWIGSTLRFQMKDGAFAQRVLLGTRAPCRACRSLSSPRRGDARRGWLANAGWPLTAIRLAFLVQQQAGANRGCLGRVSPRTCQLESACR